MAQDIDFVVNGERFCISQEILTKYPNSFFTTITAQSWRSQDSNKAIEIERDAVLFRYIVDFMRIGCLPRNRKGQSYLNADILRALLVEADYYQLQDLIADCQTLLYFRENDAFRVFSDLRNYFFDFPWNFHVFRRVLSGDLLDQLHSFVKPTCFGGHIFTYCFFKTMKTKSILDALLAQPVFIRVDGVLEVPTDVMTELLLSDISEVARSLSFQDVEAMMDTDFDIIPNTILIYRPGVGSRSQPWQHRLPEQVGSLICKVPSYTGNLTVCCEGTSQPCNELDWVALFEGCTYTVTKEETFRVFAVFDLVPRTGAKKRRFSDSQPDIHFNNTIPDSPETYIPLNDCSGKILDGGRTLL